MTNEPGRRSRLDLMTPQELAIREALIKVEEAGAHPELTVVTMLSDAQRIFADWRDSGCPGSAP